MTSAGIPLPVVVEKDGNVERAYDLYSRLLKDRIIFVGTEIVDASANAIIAQLLFLESADPDKDIYMYINSPGGSVTASLGIYDTMRYVKPDIVTVCVGQAASGGCFLLSSGTKGKRFSLPHSRIMMHHVQGGQQGSLSDVTVRYKEMVGLNDILMEVLAENTGQSLEKVKSEFERDKYMSALDAKEFGLIDDIHVSSVRSNHE